MIISSPQANLVRDERDIYEQLLPLQGADILELGCGKAEKTRAISQNGKAQSITALEVDEIQHAANLRNNDLANVTFRLGGAEAIPAADESFDIVLMFKSLHHVPVERMDHAMAEICRVLKPGGLAYISEPVFAGEFNEILRLFHDEKAVREAAFSAVERAVASWNIRAGERDISSALPATLKLSSSSRNASSMSPTPSIDSRPICIGGCANNSCAT